MSRRKPAPDLIRGGHRFAEKDMRQCVNLERVPIPQERGALSGAPGQAVRAATSGARQMANRLAKTFNCPTEFTLQVLGGKWKTVILCYLKVRPLRYAELRRLMPRLSDKVLTQRLRELVDAGLVSRQKSGGKSDVYALAERAGTLSRILRELYVWGDANAAGFGVKVGQPLKTLKDEADGRNAAKSESGGPPR
jgi:DNA-binding HxlR family transcriptional regulator